MNNDFMFQYLKEKVDKGFPAPKFSHLLKTGQYIYVPAQAQQSYSDLSVLDSGKILPKDYRVAMFFDGPFFPIRNGVCYTINNLMRALSSRRGTNVNFINCYRGWDEISSYYGKDFNSTFLTPTDFYTDTGVLEEVLIKNGINIAHFFDTEVLTSIGPLLRRLGIKIVLETQNIDHVLLERLGLPDHEVTKAKQIQVQAIEMADFNLFRSEVDMDWGLKLGANANSSSVYKGAIWVADFSFKPRQGTKNLVFLGHMFYQPNENALNEIAHKILPKLSADYSLTVIGITPPELIMQYKDNLRITFLNGVNNLNEELLKYDVALAPLLEGSGTRLKLLDYLASGLPVIATSLAIEGLNSKISEFIVIEDDIGRYDEHIRKIGKDLEHFQTMSKAGRAFVEDEYDWPNCIVPFLDAYHKILN